MMKDTNKKYLIGLDLGTTCIKGILTDTGGSIVSRARSERIYSRTGNGCVEYRMEQYYAQTAALIKQLAAAIHEGSFVSAVSAASAGGDTVLVGDNGLPSRGAISWLDTRVVHELDDVLGRPDAEEIYKTVGWPLLNIFPLAHLCWIRQHTPDVLDKASKICLSTDYIFHMLTGKWGIDTSTATTSYLQDQVKSEWDRSLLDKLGIPVSKLPAIYRSCHVLGQITKQASIETGLTEGTDVVLGSFDHPSAARGSGILDEGRLMISCGTSWVGFYPVRDRDTALTNKLLTDPFMSADGGCHAGMFSLPAAGEKADLYVSRYISDKNTRYDEFDRLSAMSAPGAGGLMIDPTHGPDDALLSGYGKQEKARAIMEGIVYRLRAKIDGLSDAGLGADDAVIVGGPSQTFPWPQIVSDILGMEINVGCGCYAGALGAALMAGIGCGIYKDMDDAYSKVHTPKHRIKPDKAAVKIYDSLYKEFERKFINNDEERS